MAAAARPSIVELINSLQSDAGGDARHDFGEAEFNFYNFYRAHYKYIGAPYKETPTETLPEEWQLINAFLKLTGDDESETNCGRAFKNAYMRHPIEPNYSRFTRIEGDPVSYTVDSRFVARKPARGDEREWRLKSAELYQFLNRGSADDFAFTIDAANVPIAEGLTRDKGTRAYNATYVLTREGITDGAMKANKGIEDAEENVVGITKKYDNDPSTVAYPATERARAAELHPTEMFFSKYPIHIPPVITNNGVRATSLQFTNREMKHQKDKFKSRAEDKNPNTISNLTKLLTFFQAAILGRGPAGLTGITNDEIDYHMCLQSKRAGDWLQVLACLFPERFGLPIGTRLRLVTHDRICFLFALKMGIDVIFTMIRDGADGATEYWLLTFYKDSVLLTPERKVLNDLSSLIDPSAPVISEKEGAYVACRNQYLRQYNATEAALIANFRTILDDTATAVSAIVPSNANDIQLETTHLHNILKAGIRLAAFRLSCIKIDDSEEQDIYRLLQTANQRYADKFAETNDSTVSEHHAFDATAYNFEPGTNIVNLFNTYISLYRNRYQVVHRAALAKRRDASAITSIVAINQYFSAFFGMGATPKSLTDRFAIIQKLTFRLRNIFKSNNLNENGPGIFTYLNSGLNSEEKQRTIEVMASIKDKISYIDYKNQYIALFKLAQLLQYSDKDTDPSPGGPSITEISSYSILKSMFLPEERAPTEIITADPSYVAALEAASSAAGTILSRTGAGAGAGAAVIEISDFYAEQIVLAKRAQDHYGEFAAGRDQLRDEAPEAQRALASFQQFGGAHNAYNHNPLTTFCIILWDLNANLACEDPDTDMLYRLSHIIEKMLVNGLKKLKTSRIKSVYAYLYMLEVFLLEGLAKELPNRNINHYMAGIKEEYYGFERITHYKKFGRPTHEEIHEYVSLKPRKMTTKQLISYNAKLLKLTTTYVQMIESLVIAKPNNTLTRRISASRTVSKRNKYSKNNTTYRNNNQNITGTPPMKRRSQYSLGRSRP